MILSKTRVLDQYKTERNSKDNSQDSILPLTMLSKSNISPNSQDANLNLKKEKRKDNKAKVIRLNRDYESNREKPKTISIDEDKDLSRIEIKQLNLLGILKWADDPQSIEKASTESKTEEFHHPNIEEKPESKEELKKERPTTFNSERQNTAGTLSEGENYIKQEKETEVPLENPVVVQEQLKQN